MEIIVSEQVSYHLFNKQFQSFVIMIKVLQSINCGAAFLIAFLVLSNPQNVNKRANQWLSFFLFCLAIAPLDSLFHSMNIYYQYPYLIGISNIIYFLLPPVFFLAIRQFVSADISWKQKDVLHFLPFGLFTICSIPFLLSSNDEKISELQDPAIADNVFSYLFIAIFFVQTGLYWIVSYRKLTQHRKNIRLIASTVDTINLIWLDYFLYGILFILSLWLLETFLNNYLHAVLLNMGFLSGIFFVAYYAMKQKDVYSFSSQVKTEIAEIIEEKTSALSPKKKLISDQELREIKEQLVHLFENKKIFLDSELSLPKLAGLMNLPLHIVSYAINEGFSENFYQIVNRYRISEAKKLLTDPQKDHLNILGIAFESGFNSKTVFNTTFKKTTGISPSEFKRTTR